MLISESNPPTADASKCPTLSTGKLFVKTFEPLFVAHQGVC